MASMQTIQPLLHQHPHDPNGSHHSAKQQGPRPAQKGRSDHAYPVELEVLLLKLTPVSKGLPFDRIAEQVRIN